MRNPYLYKTKRSIDLICSILAIIFLSPVLLMVVLIIKIRMGSPVLYAQIRSGFMGRPFKIYKFRTMNNKRDSCGVLLTDEKRLTLLGNFLRSTSLDELPELFNILKGEMSLVGPRPLLMQYMNRYTREQARRHEVKPGLTGWAQVNGRNNISWKEKFKLDVWYADNWSLYLDLKILLLTILVVLRRNGVSKEGYATTVFFEGNENE